MISIIVESSAEITLVESVGSSIGESDGRIIILASGSAGPFEVMLEKDGIVLDQYTRDFINGLHMFEELGPGSYSVWVKDRFGCETKLDVVITQEACFVNIIVTEKEGPSTCDYCNTSSGTNPCTSDGEISIIVDSNIDDYTVTWIDTRGEEYPEAELTLGDLTPGQYIVRVESAMNDCSDIEIINLPACTERTSSCATNTSATGTPTILNSIILGVSGPNASDGAILLDIAGLTSSTNIVWTDGRTGPVVGNGTSIYNLSQDFYCANITSGCSFGTMQECFEVGCVMRHRVLTQVDNLENCNDSSPSLTIDLEGVDNSLFNYEWDDGTTGLTVSTPEFREYCVTISDPGSDCVQEYCVTPDIPGFRVVEVEGVCPESSDGSITLNVSNPLDMPVSISLNGFSYAESGDESQGSLFNGDFVIHNLAEGDYFIEVSVGDCIYSQAVDVGVYDVERIFVETHEILDVVQCEFQLVCKGTVLPEEFNIFEDSDLDISEASGSSITVENILGQILTVVPAALFDFIGLGSVADAIAGFFGGGASCKAPARCGDVSIGEQDLGSNTVRIYEYYFLLQAASQSLTPQLFDHLNRGLLDRVLDNPCERITYCRSSYEIVGGGNVGLHGLGGRPGAVIEDGCIRHFCGSITGSTDCLIEILERHSASSIDFDGCTPERAILEDLVFMIDNNFELSGPIREYAEENRFHEGRFCAEILYCSNNGHIISSNLETAYDRGFIQLTDEIPGRGSHDLFSCGLKPIEGEFDLNGEFGTLLQPCFKPSKFDREDLSKNLTSIDFIREQKLLNQVNFTSNQYLSKIYDIVSLNEEGAIYVTPALSISSDQVGILQEFRHGVFQEKVLTAHNIESVVVDNTDSWACSIEKVPNACNILINDRGQLSNMRIIYDGSISEISVIKLNDKVLIYGIGDGDITFDDNDFEVMNGVFVIVLNRTGELDSIYTYDSLEEIVFDHNLDHFGFAARTANSEAGRFVKYFDGALGQTEFEYGLNLEIMAISLSHSGNLVALEFVGSGSVLWGNEIVELNDEIGIMTYNSSDGILASWRSSADNVDLERMNIEFGEEGQLFGVVNYNKNITFDDEIIVNSGASDILVFELDQYLEQVDKTTISSSNYESAHILHYSHGVLYFGGEVINDLDSFVIGEIQYLDSNPNQHSKAYMSYITVNPEMVDDILFN